MRTAEPTARPARLEARRPFGPEQWHRLRAPLWSLSEIRLRYGGIFPFGSSRPARGCSHNRVP